MTEYRWSQNLLRIGCYMVAGRLALGSYSKWYWGFFAYVIGSALIFSGLFIEDNKEESS